MNIGSKQVFESSSKIFVEKGERDFIHARWEIDELGFLICSNCGFDRAGIPIVWKFFYCPICGAKMDLEGDK